MDRLIEIFAQWPMPVQVGMVAGTVFIGSVAWCCAWRQFAVMVRGYKPPSPPAPPQPPSPPRSRDADVLQEFRRGLSDVLEQSQPIVGEQAIPIIEQYARACGSHLGVNVPKRNENGPNP